MSRIAALTILIAIIVALAALVPLGVIWSLNTLFGTGIPYTVTTWAAAFLLTTIVWGDPRSPSR